MQRNDDGRLYNSMPEIISIPSASDTAGTEYARLKLPAALMPIGAEVGTDRLDHLQFCNSAPPTRRFSSILFVGFFF